MVWFNLWRCVGKGNQAFLKEIDNLCLKLLADAPSTYVNCLKVLAGFNVEDLRS